MATEIKMPQLSDTMDSGKILEWSKKEGDEVKRGDVLALIETDKANLEIESYQNGTLLKIITTAGSSATVGEVIAIVGDKNEAVNPSSSSGNTSAEQKSSGDSSKEKISELDKSGNSAPSSKELPVAQASQEHTPPQHQNGSYSGSSDNHGQNERIKASPLARKIATQNNIDLAQVKGTGPSGRIVKKDVDAESTANENGSRVEHESTPQPSAASLNNTDKGYEQKQPSSSSSALSGKLTSLTKMRETIARRMQESMTQSPHFYTTASILMDDAVRLRELLKEKEEYKGISINHLVIKAVAYALRNEPRVNMAMRENKIFEPDAINIGIITAVKDGLLIPVIKDADKLSLKDLVFEAKAAVDRARAGRPNSSDLSGGTFSISNMGMYDIENFTAIINPGQGGILAVSSTHEEPVVKNGNIVIAKKMRVTLSVDHRIIDGIMAGNFLKYLKEALEVPSLMLL